jgi:hypothetical protein
MEQQNNAAKFAFLYMLSLVALVFISLSTGMIIFQLINKYVPDILNKFAGQFSEGALKFAISALIISAPIYYFTMRQISKSLFGGGLDKDSGVRKWLTYLIIFVAFIVMIGWLIGLLTSFLNGELTMKFILKAITAIGISVVVFTYYLYDIRRGEVVGKKDMRVAIYFYGSLVIIAAAFITALFIVESPTAARNRMIDNSVLDNFNKIDAALNTYYQQNKKLPSSLDVLKGDYYFLTDQDLTNPADNTKFEFIVKSTTEYELCTQFLTSNKTNNNNSDYYNYKDRWPHDTGRQCLKQIITDFNKNVVPVQ